MSIEDPNSIERSKQKIPCRGCGKSIKGEIFYFEDYPQRPYCRKCYTFQREIEIEMELEDSIAEEWGEESLN